MSSSFAVRWLLNSRVTRIAQCGLLFRISESTTLKSPLTPRFALSGLPRRGKEVVYSASTLTTYKPAGSIVSASTTNAMSSTRCTVCVPWTLAYARLLSVLHFAPSKQCCIPHVAVSHLWVYLPPDPIREIDVKLPRRHSKHRRVFGLVGLPRLSKLQAPGHASRNRLRWCACFSSFARHFSVKLKMPPVGLHWHCHTLRSTVSSASVLSVKISGNVRRGARLTH